ncbi:MAG: cupin domain-containing protein [Spirochaetia bacterium]|nr:cupin domain-containing protein [Spirochaetia bacterium]
MSLSQKQNMRGGKGTILLKDLMEKGTVAHCRLFSQITIRQGCSIGQHDHVDETEYYWILKGEGIVTEADGEKQVAAGDMVVTGGGASHAIRNDKEEDLVLMALIILD